MPSTKKKRRSWEPKRPFSERNGKYLSLEEVADYFGVTKRKVKYMVAHGHGVLKSVKIGGIRRVHVDDLADYEREIRPS